MIHPRALKPAQACHLHRPRQPTHRTFQHGTSADPVRWGNWRRARMLAADARTLKLRDSCPAADVYLSAFIPRTSNVRRWRRSTHSSALPCATARSFVVTRKPVVCCSYMRDSVARRRLSSSNKLNRQATTGTPAVPQCEHRSASHARGVWISRADAHVLFCQRVLQDPLHRRQRLLG